MHRAADNDNMYVFFHRHILGKLAPNVLTPLAILTRIYKLTLTYRNLTTVLSEF